MYSKAQDGKITGLRRLFNLGSLVFLVSAFSSMVTLSHADVINLKLGNQAGTDPNLTTPERGTTMADVINAYGEPVTRYHPIGNPPITKWSFAEFSVYFEHNFVIRSVVHHTPQHSPQP